MTKLNTKNAKKSSKIENAAPKSRAKNVVEKEDEPSSSQTSDFFTCDIQSYEESLNYAKKMIVVAISNIAYLRALWPEQFFVDRFFENLQLKIIGSRRNEQAHVLTKWILGVFDALENKYLRQFTLSIFLDENNLEDVMETYEFNVAYNDRVNLEIMTRDDRKQKIRTNSVRFIRHLMYASQMLEDLPEMCYMNLRLFYYDEVTPVDYEPPGFKPADYTDFRFAEGRVQLPVGKLHSIWHMLDFRVNASRTLVRDFDELEKAGESVMKTNVDDDEDTQVVNLKNAHRLIAPASLITDSQPNVSPLVVEDRNATNLTSGYESILGEHGLATSTPRVVESLVSKVQKLNFESNKQQGDTTFDDCQDKASNETRDVTNDETFVVDCDCGLTDTSDIILIKCSKCLTKQHAVCYRIWIEDEQTGNEWSQKYNHYCRNCFLQLKESRPRQIDRAIYETNESKVQKLCLVRRLVHWIWQLKGTGFTSRMIADQFSIDRKSVMDILNEIRETFKVKMDSKKKGSYQMDQIDLGKIIDECFSHPMRRKSGDSQLSNQVSQEMVSKSSNINELKTMITDESKEDELKSGDSIGGNKSKSRKSKDKLDRVDSKSLRLSMKKIKVSLSGVTKLKRRPS